MYSERRESKSASAADQHRHSEVLSRSLAFEKVQDEDMLSLPPFDTHSHFLNGDFSSGIVKQIPTPTGCWTLAFSHKADMLAVGLKDQVDIFETTNYTLISSLATGIGKVSAIQWCRGFAFSRDEAERIGSFDSHAPHRMEDGEFLAVASLEGQLIIFQLDAALVELKGPQTIYQWNVDAEIRCMTFQPLENGGAFLAVGDKGGRISLITLYRDWNSGQVHSTIPAVLDFEGDAILGLDCYVGGKNSILAAGTKSGKVIVHEMKISKGTMNTSFVQCGKEIWRCERNGSVRAVVVSAEGNMISLGGYDKTIARVDVQLRAIVRELALEGTINTIAFDPLNRFLVVGCRDKSITFFDTTTFYPIKKINTPGWVTSISWGAPGIWSDILAVRSENKSISLIDLTPTNITNIELATTEKSGSCTSWSPDGNFLARISGDYIPIVDARCGFTLCSKIEIPGSSFRSIAFAPKLENVSSFLLAAVGLDGNVTLFQFEPQTSSISIIHSIQVERDLWYVAWSHDGKHFAVGGKGKTLSLFSVANAKLIFQKAIKMEGRIWDIAFSPHSQIDPWDFPLAVASGDYKMHFLTMNLKPTLQVVLSRTVRCVDYHPKLPHVAIGDGAGCVTIVDFRAAENVNELVFPSRINSVKFSCSGDFLLVGGDDCTFTLHETETYQTVQELARNSFAVSASFSPSGKYLVLGSANDEPYVVMRMGALLGIDLYPLDNEGRVPKWALDQVLFRSGYGPPLVQRHMLRGSPSSLLWLTKTLRGQPDTIYTVNRNRKEGCLEMALRLGKAKLLQVSVKVLVDGSLEKYNNGERSILTTQLPETGRRTLKMMLESHPVSLIVEILQSLTFVKVPFTKSRIVDSEKRVVCGSCDYLDPWKQYRVFDDSWNDDGGKAKVPAVLPIPGLGSMKFLSVLVSKAPATAFDTEAMGMVLKVLWQHHIWKYYAFDTIIFVCYYGLWLLLIENNNSYAAWDETLAVGVAYAVIVLNSFFAMKEVVQSNFGRRPDYFASKWNLTGIASIVLVYGFAIRAAMREFRNEKLVPLAVVTTLLLTMKLISYLRAFNQTGWLVTVLSHNFWDVRGFLLVLLSIITGFAASFRILFASEAFGCGDGFAPDDGKCTDENPFGSLRRAILSTFELTILGTYEPSLLQGSSHTVLSIIVFVLAVTCVLVVALNALISLLADSYARVQEDAIANERKERAEMIVEYMSLLPGWRRRQIEKSTRYFHALLEADAEGDLVVDDDDWKGGLNALRDDIEESSKLHTETQLKAMESLKADFEKEVAKFRTEMVAMLQDLSEDMKQIKEKQNELGVGGAARGAVQAVKEIRRKGTSLFKQPQKQE